MWFKARAIGRSGDCKIKKLDVRVSVLKLNLMLPWDCD